MRESILILQIVVSVVFILFILVQNKGTGLGRGWSASTNSFTKRGIERVIFRGTFVLAAIFCLLALALLFV